MKVYVFLYDSTKYEVFINKEVVYVKEVIFELLNNNPKLKNKLNNDIESLDIFHNTILRRSKIINLNSVMKDGDEIIILPLISGG